MIVWLLALPQVLGDLPHVIVDRDDLVIRESCVLETGGSALEDRNGDGLIQIVGDGITVAFVNRTIRGTPEGTPPDQCKGTGIVVTGKDVTLRGPNLAGFRCGIRAKGADGLVIEGADVSDNFAMRLKSTPRAEDGADWLWPHENDRNEWLERYGAGIYVEESKGVTLRSNRARRTQNGICLRRVDDSLVYDNDMSFLSGWGLAMFRSSRNKVSRNSFDFCIRGYSHGVYSRGQDSAGILFFEQCNDNVFAFNSATHSGDGFFGFAGKEALEREGVAAGTGCNRNLLYGNDFSYAAAIGIELTFSFDNVFARNKLVGSNYGVWGGYSSRTQVRGNEIADNTLAGIAVEHGSGWSIAGNSFARNERAIELWWDEDKDLLERPWAKLNPTANASHWIRLNQFEGDKVQFELRGPSEGLSFDAAQKGFERARWKVPADAAIAESVSEAPALTKLDETSLIALPGQRKAVGLRDHLAGRETIVMTEWGPYDWQSSLLARIEDKGGAHAWRLYGNEAPITIDAGPNVRVKLDASVDPAVILLEPRVPGEVVGYTLKVRLPARTLEGSGTLLGTRWNVTFGRWQTDPRENEARWREEVAGGPSFETGALHFAFGSGGPSELPGIPREIASAALGRERFGTLASTALTLPAGRWRISVTSDDGVRVKADGVVLIEDWSHHGPKVDVAELALEAAREVRLEVAHFELDGWAVLELELERID
jgi:parallel beta-helix repeat protein